MARPRKSPEVEPATEEVVEVPEVSEPESEVEAPEVEPATEEEVSHRFETFEAIRPDGVAVVVERNIDTGEQTVTEK